MNETYQQPGRWHELVLTPPLGRTDTAHHFMVNILVKLLLFVREVFIILALSDVCSLRNAINNFPSILNIFLFPPTRLPPLSQTYTIRGLENNSVYEAIVQAKNQYGWNEVINLFNYDYFHPACHTPKSIRGAKFSLIIYIFN